MNITEVQVNDEIEANGIRYLVRKLPYRLTSVGEMARTVRVLLVDLRGVPTADDGALELGTDGGATKDFDEAAPVTVLRSNVQYRSVLDYIAPENADHPNGITRATHPQECAHADLVRSTLRRKEKQQEANAEDAAFRLKVKSALRAGMSVAKIREITGLSRERIYQIRDGRR